MASPHAVEFAPGAYHTLMLHAYKHPELAVNGVLLGSEAGGAVRITRAVPLFHGITSLLPMLEAAMLQVDELCASIDLKVVGYYHANERRADCELGHVARKISERIQSRFNPAVIALIDNRGMHSADKIPLLVFSLAGSVWTPLGAASVRVDEAEKTVPALAKMVAAGTQHSLVDFDSHLDDVSRPWLDQKLPLV